jgi:hypothetical protein
MRRQILKLVPRLTQAQAQVARGAALQFRGYADDANLLKTSLYDFHVAHGGECATGAAPRDGSARPARAQRSGAPVRNYYNPPLRPLDRSCATPFAPPAPGMAHASCTQTSPLQ